MELFKLFGIIDIKGDAAIKTIEDVAKKAGVAEKQMQNWQKTAVAVGKGLTAAGTAIIGSMSGMLVATVNAANAVDKLAKQTGQSREELQALGYAAQQEHASLEGLAQGLVRLSRNMLDAAAGTGEAKDVFKALGISLTDAQGNLRSSADVMLDIADVMASIPSETEATAVAMRLFGRSGAELVPFLRMGGDEIRRLAQEARDLGYVMGEESVKELKVFDDQLTAVKAGFTGVGRQIAVAILPYAKQFADWLTNAVKWFNNLPEPLRRSITLITALGGALSLVVGPMALLVGYLPQIKAGLLMLQGAFTPFLVGGAIIAGLIAIVTLFQRMKEDIKYARLEIGKLTDTVEAQKALEYWQGELEQRKRAVKAPDRDTMFMIVAAGGKEEYVAQAQKKVDELKKKINELAQAEVKAATGTNKLSLDIDLLGTLSEETGEKQKTAAEILDEMNKALKNAVTMEEALGKNFDLNQAKADIFRKTIEELIAAGLTPQDKRLKDIITRYESLVPLLDKSKQSMYELAKASFERKVFYEGLSPEEQVQLWEKSVAIYAKTNEEKFESDQWLATKRKEIEDESLQTEEENRQKRLADAESWVAHEVAMSRMGLDEQIKAYKRILENYKLTEDEKTRIRRQIELLEKQQQDESEDRARRQAELEVQLYRDRLERAGDTLAVMLLDEKQRYEQELELAKGNKELIEQVEREHANRVAQIRADYQKQQTEEQGAELENWASVWTAHEVAMGRMTKTQQLAALKEVVQINQERGVNTEELARFIERLEKEVADETTENQQRAADSVRELLAERLELEGKTLEASIERELLARDQKLRNTALTEQERELIIANSEAKISKLRQDYENQRANDLESWAEEYINHEIQMGRATKQNLLDALKEVLRINKERGADTEKLARKIEALEKEIADETIANQRKNADLIRQLYIERLELEGKTTEAAIEREKASLDERLRDETLTDEARIALRQNSELAIAKIRKEARDKEAADLEAWVESYFDYLIEMGQADKQQKLAALKETERINAAKGADTIDFQRKIAKLEKEIADEAIASQQRVADNIKSLIADRLEAEGKALEAAILREELAREQKLRDTKLTEEERQLIIANSEEKIASLRREYQQREADDLVSWTQEYLGHEIEMGRATKENLLAALKEAKRINEERGADTSKLARLIESLEKQIADEKIAQEQRVYDRTLELMIEAMELRGDELEAAIAREKLEREKALRDEELTQEQRQAIIENSEARIAQIRKEYAERQAQDLASWTETYINHEIEMGRATKENLLAGLKEARRINEERGVFLEELNQKIERLEKEIADDTIAEQKRVHDSIVDLTTEAMELRGETLKAAIEREKAARERALRDEKLTEQERQMIIVNSEARIEQIRKDARKKDSDELVSWTETYIGHEIEIGRATKQNLLDALKEAQRINEKRGEYSEELQRKIELLEKEIADDTVTQQNRILDKSRELYIQRLELEGKTEEAAIQRAMLRRDQALRNANLSKEEQLQIEEEYKLEIERIRKDALDKQNQDLVSWTETYINHEIQMGRATKENLLAGLNEAKRILEERGIYSEELARKIELLEKEIMDDQKAYENQLFAYQRTIGEATLQEELERAYEALNATKENTAERIQALERVYNLERQRIMEKYGLERNLTEWERQEILKRLQNELAALDMSVAANRERAAALKGVMAEISGTMPTLEQQTAQWGQTLIDGLARAIAYGEDLMGVFDRLLVQIAEWFIKYKILMPLLGPIFGIAGFGGGLLGGFGLFHFGGLVEPIRAHSGYLAHDEVPAILQTGERVLSREQNAVFEELLKRPMQVNLTVHAVDAQSFVSLAQRHPEAITSVIVQNIQRNGEIRRVLMSR